METTHVTLRHKHKPHHNAKINIPIDGEIEVIEGKAKVSADAAKLLVKHSSDDWEYDVEEKAKSIPPKAKDEKKPEDNSKKTGEKKIKGAKPKKANEGENQEKVILTDEQWEALTAEQLIEIAQATKNLNKYKLFTNNIKSLRSYVKNNINK